MSKHVCCHKCGRTAEALEKHPGWFWCVHCLFVFRW